MESKKREARSEVDEQQVTRVAKGGEGLRRQAESGFSRYRFDSLHSNVRTRRVQYMGYTEGTPCPLLRKLQESPCTSHLAASAWNRRRRLRVRDTQKRELDSPAFPLNTPVVPPQARVRQHSQQHRIMTPPTHPQPSIPHSSTHVKSNHATETQTRTRMHMLLLALIVVSRLLLPSFSLALCPLRSAPIETDSFLRPSCRC